MRTYGSSHADGLDAIQIEIASPLRDDAEKRAALIEYLAYAIGNLVGRYADAHTLAAFQNINLGGQSRNRGRVEIRHDPGATGEGVAPRRAGVLVLNAENGNDYYLWVDNQGRLRVSPSDPGAISQAGTVVGKQT